MSERERERRIKATERGLYAAERWDSIDWSLLVLTAGINHREIVDIMHACSVDNVHWLGWLVLSDTRGFPVRYRDTNIRTLFTHVSCVHRVYQLTAASLFTWPWSPRSLVRRWCLKWRHRARELHRQSERGIPVAIRVSIARSPYNTLLLSFLHFSYQSNIFPNVFFF